MIAALMYWSLALAMLAAAVLSAFQGWRQIQRGDVLAHRRSMHRAIGLILTFLASYVLKVLFLGKEDLASWSPGAVALLRTHEAVVGLMLLSGAAARILARKLKGLRDRREVPRSTAATAHRWLGRTAVLAGGAAFLTASMILVGMYLRARGG